MIEGDRVCPERLAREGLLVIGVLDLHLRGSSSLPRPH